MCSTVLNVWSLPNFCTVQYLLCPTITWFWGVGHNIDRIIIDSHSLALAGPEYEILQFPSWYSACYWQRRAVWLQRLLPGCWRDQRSCELALTRTSCSWLAMLSTKPSNLSWYSLMSWYTYPRNETLVHQQLSLHQLHHPHSTETHKAIFPLVWRHTFIIRMYKIITTCIEHTTVLRTNNMRVTHEVKACLAIHDW